MSDTTAPTADPGSAPPDQWSEPLPADELAEILGRVDNPDDPLVIAGLAGTLYDPDAPVGPPVDDDQAEGGDA